MLKLEPDAKAIVSSKDEIGALATDINNLYQSLLLTIRNLELEKEKVSLAEKEKIDFLRTASHELKTPLTSIIGYGDMLRSKRLNEEEVIGYSNLIVEEGRRLEAMSMKLLELIVLKKQDFKMYWVTAETFFQGIVDTVDLLMKEQQIEFIIEIEPGK